MTDARPTSPTAALCRPRPVGAHALLLPALGLAAMLGAAAPASAQETSFTEQFLTTFGLVPPSQPEIEYRERAPLVVPPTAGDMLPPPRDTAAITENPAWPKDYDQEQKKKAAAIAKKTPVFVNDNTQTRALGPGEVNGTRTGVASNHQAQGRNAQSREDWIKPLGYGLFSFGQKKEEKPVAFTGEPERESLTEPPPGYQTPAPGAAYGTVAERTEDKTWNPLSWFDQTQRNKSRN